VVGGLLWILWGGLVGWFLVNGFCVGCVFCVFGFVIGFRFCVGWGGFYVFFCCIGWGGVCLWWFCVVEVVWRRGFGVCVFRFFLGGWEVDGCVFFGEGGE